MAVVCIGLRWFAVVWPFLTAHRHTDVLSSQILVVICGGLRWCVVVCCGSSSSSSDTVQGSVLLPHYRTLEVRPGRIS